MNLRLADIPFIGFSAEEMEAITKYADREGLTDLTMGFSQAVADIVSGSVATTILPGSLIALVKLGGE